MNIFGITFPDFHSHIHGLAYKYLPYFLSNSVGPTQMAITSKDTLKIYKATKVSLKDLQRIIKFLETPRKIYIFQKHPKTTQSCLGSFICFQRHVITQSTLKDIKLPRVL